jgi:hypothetical protein
MPGSRRRKQQTVGLDVAITRGHGSYLSALVRRLSHPLAAGVREEMAQDNDLIVRQRAKSPRHLTDVFAQAELLQAGPGLDRVHDAFFWSALARRA